jgi:serine/threonine-protein kinase
LTGVVPFAGPTGPAILLAILTRDPSPPSETGKEHGIPKTLDDVMEEALTKEPDIRIKTIGGLADKFGAAYGLDGNHLEWAKVPQDQLAARIKQGLPAALQRHAQKAAPPNVQAMDAAFQAGSQGGPIAAPSQFDDEGFAMGVPQGRPKWLVPAVAGAAVLFGALVLLLFFR